MRKSTAFWISFVLAFVISSSLVFAVGTTLQNKAAATPTPKPNVLYIMMDDQGCDNSVTELCDQVQYNMPFLASRPGGNWSVFDYMETITSLCCPARAVNLTGQTVVHNGQYGNGGPKLTDSRKYPSENGQHWEVNSLAPSLKNNGYKTGLFGKYANWYNGNRIPVGWDRWVADKASPAGWTFDVYDQGSNYFVCSNGSIVPGTTNTCPTGTGVVKNDAHWHDYFMANKAKEFITTNANTGSGQPWFSYVAFYAPHGGSSYPSNSPPDSQLPDPPALPNTFEGCPNSPSYPNPITDKPSFVQDNACKTNSNPDRASNGRGQWGVDHAFQDLYNTLVSTGQLDNTIIVFTNDNSLSLGSHRIGQKECAYQSCQQVNLMVRAPGTTQKHVPEMVSNVDIMSTLMEATGSTTTKIQDGFSFWPLVTGVGNYTPRVDLWSRNGAHYGVSGDANDYDTLIDNCHVKAALNEDCFYYIEYRQGQRELYNMTTDPYQLDNLIPTGAGYPGQPGWDWNHPVVVDMHNRLLVHKNTGR